MNRRNVFSVFPLLGIIAFSLAVAYVCAFSTSSVEVESSKALVHVYRLEVQPHIVTVGGHAIFYNGLCNESKKTVTVEIWLGAEKQDTGTLSNERVHLLSRPNQTTGEREAVVDTPEGRIKRALEPGCHDAEPINIYPVPPILTNGKWKLVLHVVIPGVQDTTLTSSVFEVVGANSR